MGLYLANRLTPQFLVRVGLPPLFVLSDIHVPSLLDLYRPFPPSSPSPRSVLP